MKQIMDGLEKGIKALIVFMMLSIVSIIALQVIFRYVLSSPLGWTDELSRYLFIWSSLLAAAIGIRKNIHIGVDFIVDRFPRVLQKVIQMFSMVIIIGFSIFLLIHGWQLSLKTLLQSSPTLGVPMGYMYIALPVFSILTLIFTIEQWSKIMGRRSNQ